MAATGQVTAAQYGQDALDLSANVSPLGLPEGVAKAITVALATADRYPDPLCRALRAKLAVHEKVPMEHILCGNGAADRIFRLVWAAKPRHGAAARPYLCGVCRRAGKRQAAPSGGIFCRKKKILR